MPRVTRAAARADPALADETQTMAEAAVSGESTSVQIVDAAADQEHQPLGETQVNVASQTDQQTETNVSITSSETTTMGVEGTNENHQHSILQASAQKPSKTFSNTGKMSTRKGAVRAGTMKQQFDKQFGEWSETVKEKPSQNEMVKAKKSQRKKQGAKANNQDVIVLEDDETTTTSPAPEPAEVIEMPSLSPAVSVDPFIVEPSVDLKDASPSTATTTQPAGDTNKMEVVDRFVALFRPDDGLNAEEPEQSPLELAIAQASPGASKTALRVPEPTTPAHPVEAIDLLEKEIAAAETSLRLARLPQSPRKATPSAVVRASPNEDKPVEKAASADALKSTVKVAGKPQAKPQREHKVRESGPRKPVSKVKPAVRSSPKSDDSTPAKDAPVEKVKEKARISALQTPPPVAKSSKPVTKSTFQLPGEAAAAKLKLLKEERERRRAEAEQSADQKAPDMAAARRASMRPPRPSAAHEPRTARTVLQTSKPAMNGSNKPSSMSAHLTGPSNGTSKARPRQSVATANTKVGNVKPVPGVPRVAYLAKANTKACLSGASTSSRTSIAPYPRPYVTRPSGLRASVNTANTAKVRDTSKGKAVFERGKLEQEANEKAVQERIEAAKKAREEATLRGKAAARAWAERGKQKTLASKSVTQESVQDVKVEEADESLPVMIVADGAGAPTVA